MHFLDEYVAALMLLDHPAPVEVEYRIYYGDNGNIVSCTTTNHPPGTQYVVTTRAIYDRYFDYTVTPDGKLEKINTGNYTNQLTKGGTRYKVVKNHAALLLSINDPYPDSEYYDRTN